MEKPFGEAPKYWGFVMREGLSYLWGSSQAALEKDRKQSLKSMKEEVQTTKPHLFSLGSYCQSTGNCKKSFLPGIQEVGGGSFGRHKYFRL